jgi:hypothetical protein
MRGFWLLLICLLLPAVGVVAWFLYAATHESSGVEYESDRSDT